MREAGVVSLNIRMVRECYQMMDLMEKQDFVFTQEDKRILLGYAFHQQDLDCVHDAVIHIAAVREKEKSQGNLEAGIIEQYAIRGGSELQERIKEYIIQLEVANINQEIANRLLVKILQDKNVDYDTLEKESVLKEAVKDCRDGESKSIIMHSTRVGLSDKQSDDFKNLQLRTIIGPLLSSYAYKEKEKVFRNYIVSDNISKEEAEKISIDILGYCPKSLIESVYQA